MNRTSIGILLAGIATAASFVPVVGAHGVIPEGLTDVQLFLNRVDGQLALTTLAPSSQNDTTWTIKGSFPMNRGVTVQIPVSSPDPNWTVNESYGVDGWFEASSSVSYSGTTVFCCQNQGSTSWSMVQGEQLIPMKLTCTVSVKDPRYSNTYECKEYRYLAAFAATEDGGRPHTHGNGTDDVRPLLSGDFSWLFTYTVPPCTSTISCPVLGGTGTYTLKFKIDGTTGLHYLAESHLGAPAPEPVAPEPAGNETAANTTAPSGDGGNGTDNGTGGSGSGANPQAFAPQEYHAQPIGGKSPGVSVAALITGLAGVTVLRRRWAR